MIAPRTRRTVEIIGGGLAGLGLALGLRRANIPVILKEAGTYPRHRVCGEFITSLDAATIDALGLDPLLADARRARSVTWWQNDQLQFSQRLIEPARCLSRHALDARMARALEETGGELVTNQRSDRSPAEGRVLATGRRPQPQSPWIGIKAHFQGLSLQDDLELHLGDQAYVGLTAVEDDRVNVCGLFHRAAHQPQRVSKNSILTDQLRVVGLAGLADRLAAAALDSTSQCTVAGLCYGAPAPAPGGLHLGDQFGLMPPFTGNGMTVALQSARLAIEPLRRWSEEGQDWNITVGTLHRSLRRELSPRLNRARHLHPWLLRPSRQRWLVRAAAHHLLPSGLLYHLLH